MTYTGHPDQHFGPVTYAQHGEDLMLLNLIHLIGTGPKTYLDLGAYDPTTISNTRLLYERGHRGVNVEANPNLIEAFERERPEDVNVCRAVGLLAGAGPLYMFSSTSGRNTMSIDEVQNYDHPVEQTLTVPVSTINQIVECCCNGRFPDILLCDIEGLDYDVLDSADFERLGRPMIICVETRRHEGERMRTMLNRKGFGFLCRMGENLIFLRAEMMQRVY